jgi:hypothetical protein
MCNDLRYYLVLNHARLNGSNLLRRCKKERLTLTHSKFKPTLSYRKFEVKHIYKVYYDNTYINKLNNFFSSKPTKIIRNSNTGYSFSTFLKCIVLFLIKG